MITRKNAIALGILMVLSVYNFNLIYGQQTPVFAEYNYNAFIINSAYAGFQEDTEITISNSGFSKQFEGSPKNFTLSFNTAINDGKIGIGAGFIQDDIGVTSSTNIFGAYSYKIFFDFKSNRPYWQHFTPTVLSFGITGGLQVFKDNLLELGITDDPRFQENVNATIPTVGLGIMFNHDTFYIGASSPNILGDKLASEDNVNLESVYYAYLGYRFYTDFFEHTMIKPNALIKQEKGAPLQADFNVAGSFNSKFELGVGYRTNASLNFLAGFYALQNLRFIYNYNSSNAKDAPIANTHGIAITYKFGKGYSD